MPGRQVLLVRPEKGESAPEDPTFQRILVPLDGSHFSESVLELAGGMAELYGGKLDLLRVVAYPIEIASPYLPHTVQMNQEVVEEAKASAKEYLENLAEAIRARGVEVETHVVVDSQAGAAVCGACTDLHTDLVVMATHGRGGLKRALLGSTADKVIRSAHTPVLVKRPPAGE